MARRMDDILEAIRSLPREERGRLVDQLRQELDETAEHAGVPIASVSIIGLFADAPDLIDQASESAMQSRESDPMRLTDG